MGPKTDFNKQGIFYLPTGANAPYYIAEEGLQKRKYDVNEYLLKSAPDEDVIIWQIKVRNDMGEFYYTIDNIRQQNYYVSVRPQGRRIKILCSSYLFEHCSFEQSLEAMFYNIKYSSKHMYSTNIEQNAWLSKKKISIHLNTFLQ